MKEPVEIKNATLLKSKQETYSRDTCISRTFIITNDIYHRIEEFACEFNEIQKEQRNIDKNDDTRHKDMKRMVDSLVVKLSEIDNNNTYIQLFPRDIYNDGSVISSEYSALADHKMKVNKLLLYAINVFGIISIFVSA